MISLLHNIFEPTRVREGNTPSVLDYILMNEEDLVERTEYEAPVGKSDHVVLTWKVTISVTRTSTKLKKLDYWKGNYAELSARLEMEMCQHTIEEKWIFFRNIVLKLANEFVPEKREFKKKKSHWISKETVKAMKLRVDAWKE